MKCPACGTRNNFYHRYCYFCGEKLGAMIDPPDQEGESQEQNASGGESAFSSYDDRDTISQKSASSNGYVEKEDYSREDYYTQENASVDEPEDYFGYPADDTPAPPGADHTQEVQPDDIDYFGYPPAPEFSPGHDTQENIAAGIAPDEDTGSDESQAYHPGTFPENPDDRDLAGTGHAKDAVSSIEKDIAAKISYMEKYMDDYLSGRVGHELDGPAGEEAEEDDTPMYNDSLDFIRIEEEEPAQERTEPKPGPAPEPKPEPKYETQPPSAPPPPAPTDADSDADADAEEDEYDPYEDEETSRMIDMLYQDESSTYPRRSRRHASASAAEEPDTEPDNPDGNTVVKVMISLVIIALMSFAGYVLYNEFLNPKKVPVVSTPDLLVTHTLDRDTLEDGTSGQRLTLYAPGAASATIFGDSYLVENDKAQAFYSDDFLLQQYQAAGDAAQNNEFTAIATVYNEDGKYIEHEIGFTLSSASVQLAVFSPEGDRVEVQGNTCTLEISVQPGALLYINGTDYTDQVGSDGLAVIDMEITGAEEIPVHIRASLDGLADTERTITLVPIQETEGESLLLLNESIPVSTSGTEVVLTGQVPPGASIETSLPQSGSPSITENGAFSLTVQVPSRPGYSLCLMRVLLDGTQVDQHEVIIEKTATFNEYTTGPWEFSPYADYQASPDLHAGYRFKIPGQIKEIVSQAEGKTICTVNLNPGGTEQLIRTWYWGDFSHTAGSSVTVYGNRWGNEGGVPRILAKYIVSN